MLFVRQIKRAGHENNELTNIISKEKDYCVKTGGVDKK